VARAEAAVRPDVRARYPAWSFPIAAWAASRSVFLIAGALAHTFLRELPPGGIPSEPAGTLNYWAHWDGGWFSSIARYGYEQAWPASTNFFPLYPTTMRGGLLLGGGPAIWGVAISLAASLAAVYFLYALVADTFGDEAARAATLVFAFFPTAFFMNAVYSESLYLATAIGAVWAARVRGDFLVAGLLGCLASSTRNVGLFLVLPLVDEWLRRRRRGTVPWSSLAPLALVPAGLLAYMFWLWRWSSHPLLFSTAVEKTWGRTLHNPADTLDRAWHAASSGAVWAAHPWRVLESASPNPAFGAMETFNLIFLVLLIALVLVGFVRLPPGLALYSAIAAALPVLGPASFSPLASVPRYFLACFPAFIVLGIVLRRRPLALAGWLAASTAFGVLFTLFFTTWRWVA
jgi:hypothetical protein